MIRDKQYFYITRSITMGPSAIWTAYIFKNYYIILYKPNKSYYNIHWCHHKPNQVSPAPAYIHNITTKSILLIIHMYV